MDFLRSRRRRFGVVEGWQVVASGWRMFGKDHGPIYVMLAQHRELFLPFANCFGQSLVLGDALELSSSFDQV